MGTRDIDDAAPSSGGAARLVLLAGTMGLLSGFLESAYRVGWHQTVRHGAASKSLDALWMAPLVEFAICTLFGGALALAAAAWPRRFTPRVVLSVLSFIAWYAVARAVPPLAWYAQVLLAAGLASVTTRRLIALASSTRAVGWCLVTLLVLDVAVAAGLSTWRSARERSAVAALPAALPDAPNVLLITLDTVRARSLSVYGYGRPTSPALESIAPHGVLFERAIAAASWTLPSHAALFSGRYPHELNVSFISPIDLPEKTLASVLTSHGYEAAGFVANAVYCGRENGLARGMLRYEDQPVSPGTAVLASSLGRDISNNRWLREAVGYNEILNRKPASRISRDFLRWEASRDRGRPFFAFLNYYDAHEPLLAPAPYDRMYGPTSTSDHLNYNGVDIGHGDLQTWLPADAANNRNAYDAAITYLDHEIGELFGELARRGLLARTLVIITADHGESLGEHGLHGHGNSLYFETLHVPLLVSFPGRVPAGVRVREAVSLRDLPATIAEVIGLGATRPFPGRSLAECWNHNREGREACGRPVLSDQIGAPFLKPWNPASRGDMASIVSGQYQYIRSADGREELYDVVRDADESRNLADTVEGRAALATLRPALAALTRRGARKPAGSPAPDRTSSPDTSTR